MILMNEKYFKSFEVILNALLDYDDWQDLNKINNASHMEGHYESFYYNLACYIHDALTEVGLEQINKKDRLELELQTAIEHRNLQDDVVKKIQAELDELNGN
jgi:hypothetical protein